MVNEFCVSIHCHRQTIYHLTPPATGALVDGGSPMSHVHFRKWQCHMSLSFIFLNVTCRI